MIKTLYAILLLSISLYAPKSSAQHVRIIEQGKPTSIRGLSIVNDKVAWVSGSNGYVALTINGGESWKWQQVRGYEKSDFRDIEAFSDKKAIIMSSGTPALILKTADGGLSWKVNYHNSDSTYFLDAMDFDTSDHGFVMGDPINGRFFMVETKNGGDSWADYDGPAAITNQAAFAASGTCLIAKGILAIVTGGAVANVITKTATTGWQSAQSPITHGQSARGAFSIAASLKHLIVVGGDYINYKKQDSTACYSGDNGQTWHQANTFPSGYQSCVEFLSRDTFIATGTAGSNITKNSGLNWMKFDDSSYNVCRKAKHGNLVLLAGDKGKIGILKM